MGNLGGPLIIFQIQIARKVRKVRIIRIVRTVRINPVILTSPQLNNLGLNL
jgi:hypothetical protein